MNRKADKQYVDAGEQGKSYKLQTKIKNSSCTNVRRQKRGSEGER